MVLGRHAGDVCHFGGLFRIHAVADGEATPYCPTVLPPFPAYLTKPIVPVSFYFFKLVVFVHRHQIVE